jgi:hypothetical protein
MNRRAILAGVGTLPAMSLPAVATDDAKLIAIGEKIKALWPAYQDACAIRHEFYKQACELAGWNEPERREAIREGRLDHEQDTARWNAEAEATGYLAAADRAGALDHRIWPLAEAASELRATSVPGYGVLAVAAIITDEFESAPAAYDILVALAGAAGFEVLEDADRTPAA